MRYAPNVGFSWEDDVVIRVLLLSQVEPPNALIAPWPCEPELFSEHQPGSQPIHGECVEAVYIVTCWLAVKVDLDLILILSTL